MATTITVNEQTLERFNAAKAETKTDHTPEMSANGFLNSLLDTHEKVQREGYGGDSADDLSVEAIVDAIDNDGLNYDDVTNACRAAIRDELGEVLQR